MNILIKTTVTIMVFCVLTLFACSKKTGSKDSAETPFFSVNFSEIKKEVELPISELVESLDVIHLENKEEAFSKIGYIYVSDNYIGCQSYGQFPYKLFDKKGRFISDIGARGQGPGEYRNVYCSQIDEENKKIYLIPYNAKTILSYSLQGKYLPEACIPLAQRIPKGHIGVDAQNKTVTVLSLPFQGEDDYLCWVQDFSGTILQSIKSAHYSVYPDYSNEIYSFNNTPSLDFHLSQFYQEKTDTLYHYNIANNKVIPVFTLNAPIDPGVLGYRYMELPNHYLVAMMNLKMGANVDNDVESTKLILVNKETQESHYVRIVNDYLGGWEFDPFFLSFRIRDGYFTTALEPIELKEYLEGSLENTGLDPEVRKRIKELDNKLDPNDNNVVMIGKLKQ